MDEAAKIRLVRCPKCENLLPELADYSVYQCGGCGAVLRAKHKTLEVDTSSNKSEEERVQGVSEKLHEKSENSDLSDQGMNLYDGSENGGGVKSNGSSFRRTDKRDVVNHVEDHQRTDSSVTAADGWVADDDPGMHEGLDQSEMGGRVEDSKPPSGLVNGSRRSGQIPDGWLGQREGFRRNPRGDAGRGRYYNHGEPVEIASGLEMKGSLDYPEMGTRMGEMKPPNGFSDGSRRSGCVADWRNGVRNEREGFRPNPRRNVEDGRYYSYEEPVGHLNRPNEATQVEYLEQDRAELLKKLDELKDQLSRSCDINEKLKGKGPLDQRFAHPTETYGGSKTWFPDVSSEASRPSSQYPYAGHYAEPNPYMNRHEFDMHRFHTPMSSANHGQRFGDPLRSSQMLRRGPNQAPVLLQPQSSHPYFSEPYVNNDFDRFEPYQANMNFHHPSCTCFHCYSQHSQVPSPVPKPGFQNRAFPDVQDRPGLYHQRNPSAFGLDDYKPEFANPMPLNSRNHRFQSRLSGDLNSDVGSFIHRRPPRVVLATGGRRCHAVAGGSPFLACYNCFELLQLPKRLLLVEKNLNKVRCGACSSVIHLSLVDKKLVISADAENNTSPRIVDEALGDGPSHPRVPANQGRMNFSSDDYDNSGYDFHSADREVHSSSTGQGVCSSSKSEEMRSLRSSSPYASEDEDSPEASNSPELASENNALRPPSGSPLQDHFDYSNIYGGANRFGNGNQSGRSEKKANSRQSSIKDVSLATEIEVPSNEYANTGTSQESGNASREEDQLRTTKVGQSFFAGIIKKSFKDFSRSHPTSEQGTSNVTVNGHPLTDRSLKKAEKLAGPIHPGQYWYDFRAGFWGVIGGPCLGIIPPYIEEFNYPMSENCAGGDTDIFVNGRELHQKDLLLLSSRGLPTTKDRSYIIEISGRVLDEDSGEELDSLGKLAPTIEKVKHGFGMKPPRAAS